VMTLEPAEPGTEALRCGQCDFARDCGHCTETVYHRDTFRRQTHALLDMMESQAPATEADVRRYLVEVTR
jgi:hypothetical protein